MKIFTTKPTRISGKYMLFLGALLTVALMTATAAVAFVSPATVNLGTAANFAVLAKTGISTTGTTSIVGDIGISPAAASYITGFPLSVPPTTYTTSTLVTGKVYAADYDPPTPTIMTTAVLDMQTAYTDAAGRTLPDATELGAGDITSMTLAPGLYKWGTGVLISAAGVTLAGSASDVWIFQIAENLTVANGAIVTLSGGAQASNIFWQVAGQTTIGTTSQFKGNILCQTLIEMQTGATLNGRALAQTAVTLEANAVTKPAAEVTPIAATKLVFGIQPVNTAPGILIAPAVTVRIVDANDNLATSDTRDVTLAIAANPSNGTLSGTKTVAASGGIATFSNLSIDMTGSGYTLRAASSPALTEATSSMFDIGAGVFVHHLAISAISTPQTAGSAFDITITAQDVNNNTVTGFTGTVTLTTNAGTITPTISSAFVNGQLTQNVTVTQTGTDKTITATISGGSETGTSNTFTINTIAPPTNMVVADVPNDNGHSLSLTWTLSIDDASLTHYYIYRSRNSQMSETRPEIETYATIEALIAAEETTTILIAKVLRGTSSYIDSVIPLNNVTYYYWMQSVTELGASKLAPVGMVTAVGEEPRQFMVSAPYPNPFNSSTTIEYVLTDAEKVTIAVYNTIGQAVYSYDFGYKAAGSHRFVFGADGLTSGMYFFRIDAGHAQSTGKLLYMK